MEALLVIAAVSVSVAAAVGLFEIAVWYRAVRLRSIEAQLVEGAPAQRESRGAARDSEVGELARR